MPPALYVLALRFAKALPRAQPPGFCHYVRSALGAGGMWPVQAIPVRLTNLITRAGTTRPEPPWHRYGAPP
jgi:hypothetical protein